MRLNTARGELARVMVENALFQDERVATEKQRDEAVIAKHLVDVGLVQHDRSGSKR